MCIPPLFGSPKSLLGLLRIAQYIGACVIDS